MLPDRHHFSPQRGELFFLESALQLFEDQRAVLAAVSGVRDQRPDTARNATVRALGHHRIVVKPFCASVVFVENPARLGGQTPRVAHLQSGLDREWKSAIPFLETPLEVKFDGMDSCLFVAKEAANSCPWRSPHWSHPRSNGTVFPFLREDVDVSSILEYVLPATRTFLGQLCEDPLHVGGGLARGASTNVWCIGPASIRTIVFFLVAPVQGDTPRLILGHGRSCVVPTHSCCPGHQHLYPALRHSIFSPEPSVFLQPLLGPAHTLCGAAAQVVNFFALWLRHGARSGSVLGSATGRSSARSKRRLLARWVRGGRHRLEDCEGKG
mmetsp:Transcript_17918/g.52371  ORF Transcript_17918/g.52371 Transcript_17918/m.52371 type:complete len:325 (-) Transcript_17918:302-1276(-)